MLDTIYAKELERAAWVYAKRLEPETLRKLARKCNLLANVKEKQETDAKIMKGMLVKWP